MNRVPAITPYRSSADLAELKAWFFDPKLRANAVKRTKALQSRGKLPHAVDATALLISVQLTEQTDTLLLRNAYSMALIRFVNGLLDPFQLGAFAVSLLSLAKNIGLPACFVEVRHMATHEGLPSLSLLRTMAQKALDWLYEKYWSGVGKSSAEFMSSIEFQGTRTSLVESQVESDLKAFRKSKRQDPEYKNALASLKSAASEESHLLVRILFILMLEKKFSVLVKLYGALFDILGPGFLLGMVLACVQNCSNLGDIEVLEEDLVEVQEWTTYLIGKVWTSNFPIQIAYQTIESAEAAKQAIKSSLSLLEATSSFRKAITSTVEGEQPKKVFALPPSLDEILREGPPTKKQRVSAWKSDVFEQHRTWSPRPFGVS